jgi:MFS family permease
MYPMLLIFAAGLFVLSQRRRGGLVLLLAAVLIGLGIGSVQACSQTIALKASPHHRKGMANSTFFLFVDLGVGVGPYLFGLFIPVTGYRGLYAVVGVFSLTCLLLYHLVHGWNLNGARDK